MGEVFDFESGSLTDTEFRKALKMQQLQCCNFWQEATKYERHRVQKSVENAANAIL